MNNSLSGSSSLFKGRHFDSAIIILYLCDMMAERGIYLAHTTILRWVLHYRARVYFSHRVCTTTVVPALRRGAALLTVELVGDQEGGKVKLASIELNLQPGNR
jgi:hypothetical protein